MRHRLVIVAALSALIAGCGSSSSNSNSNSSSSSSSPASGTATSAQAGAVGFEGIALEQGSDLAPASTTQTGTVNGISCGPTEQLAYHIHAHLQVYLDGSPRALPAGVGIPGSATAQTSEGPVAAGGQCIYWLHTHAPDGVIHVESPTARVYTLGDFFDEWHQPLGTAQVAGAAGKVTAFVDGKPWTKDPRVIPLLPHAVIQLDVGTAAPAFQNISWSGTRL
jgi:hypothetical protein